VTRSPSSGGSGGGVGTGGSNRPGDQRVGGDKTYTSFAGPRGGTLRDEPSRQPVMLGPSGAQLLAWVGVAIVNAVVIATHPVPPNGWGVRVAWHLYDAGQILALGLVSAGVVALWQRFGPKRRILGILACAVWAVLVGMLVMRVSLRGVAEQIALSRGADIATEPEPYLTIVVILASLCVPGALVFGRLAARPKLRWIAVAMALLVTIGNEFVLTGDYQGIHFFLVWAATTLAAAAVTGVVLPKGLEPLHRGHRPTRIALLTAVSLGAAWTVAVWPSSRVATRLFRVDGAVMVAQLARVQALLAPEPSNETFDYVARGDAPIPASKPALVAPNAIVIFITVDAMRADLFERKEFAKRLPHLTRLRDEEVFFSLARSPASGTRVALTAIFSSHYFSQMPWTNPGSGRLVIRKPLVPRFTEMLQDAEVQTAQIVSDYRALVQFAGLMRGFDEQRVMPREGKGKFNFALSPTMIDAAIERLAKQSDERALFLYMHLLDPHRPYTAAGTDGSKWERYVREVELVDEHIGRLRNELETTGLWDRTTLIVSADHGEAHGLHGTPYHNRNLYEELVRVPLMMRVPGVAGRRVDTPVSLIDLGPTILDLMSVDTPGSFMGESLVPHLRGENPKHERPIICEHSGVRAMFTDDNFKVIIDRNFHREEVYDLTIDPGERHNLRDAPGARGDERKARLQAFFRVHAPRGEALADRIVEMRARQKAAEERKRERKRK
jgi:Sulfatase